MKGICFIEPLFNRVVAGTKTQTRRICQYQFWSYSEQVNANTNKHYFSHCRPKYKIGEVLYLKEPYAIAPLEKESKELYPELPDVIYKYGNDYWLNIKWQNKLFMPAKYARYFIKVIDVKVERLQDISDKDARKEGVDITMSHNLATAFYHEGMGQYCYNAVESYAVLINGIVGPGTWEENPYMWVYDFKLHELPF